MRLLLAAVLVVTTTAANAFELKRDSSGEVASWKTPLHFVIDEKLSSKLKAPGSEEAVRAAMKAVSDAIPSLSLTAEAGKPNGMGYDFGHPEKSTSDVIATHDWQWNVNAIATTIITISRKTHQIIEADIAFNAKHREFAVIAGDQASTGYDVQNTMTHELGHAVGLAHNDIPDTVMFPSSDPGEVSKRWLAADDVNGLKFLYAQPTAVTPEEAVRGCNATGSAPIALIAVMMVVLMRRRRVLVALAAVLGAVVFVAPVFAAAPVALEPTWKVSAVITRAPSTGPAVLESEITFVRDGEVQTVRVLGGRWGDLEQVVEGHAVPMVGETFQKVGGH